MSPEDAAARKALGVDQAIALWKLERLSGLMSLLNAARSKLMNPGMAVQLSTKEEEAHGYLRDAIYLLFDEQLAVEHQLYELLVKLSRELVTKRKAFIWEAVRADPKITGERLQELLKLHFGMRMRIGALYKIRNSTLAALKDMKNEAH